MTTHPNRSQRSHAPGRNPTPAEIRGLRKQMGLAQGEFAELLYCSRRAVEDWEQGLKRMPGLAWEYANLLWRYAQVSAARMHWLAKQRQT